MAGGFCQALAARPNIRPALPRVLRRDVSACIEYHRVRHGARSQIRSDCCLEARPLDAREADSILVSIASTYATDSRFCLADFEEIPPLSHE